MAKVQRTATGFMVIPVDPLSFDPTSEGYTAEVGGLASYNGVLYYKFGGNDIQWSAVGVVPTLHVLAPITGDGSVGSPFAISAATDSTAGSLSAADKTLIDGIGAVSTWAPGGVTFNQPVTLPSTQQGVQASYTTALLDLIAAADNIPINIPQRAGFVFIPNQNANWLVLHDITGTATGPLSISVGNDAARTNTMGVVTIAAGTLNAFHGFTPYPIVAPTGAGAAMIDSGTQIVAKIVTGITGVTSAHGYIEVAGFWVPV